MVIAFTLSFFHMYVHISLTTFDPVTKLIQFVFHGWKVSLWASSVWGMDYTFCFFFFFCTQS